MNYRATSLFFLSIFFVFLAFLFWGEGEEHTDGLYPKNETLTEQFQPSISQEKPDSSFNLSNDSNKVCDELMRNFEAIVHIESKRKKIIEDYFSKILKNGADWQILDLLAVQSGMPVSDIVNYLPKNKSALRQVKNIVLTFDLEFILDENLRRLESLFLNGNYEEIKNTIGIHSKHKLYAGLPLFFYGIQKTEKEHASEMLSTLFAQGVKPTLLDVVWATKYETPSFLTAQLVSNISNSEEIFWEGEGQLQSLSIVLATHFNYQSLELWLNKIDTSNQLKQKGSELDRLPIPSSNEMKSAIKTVEILLKSKRKVQTHVGLRKLKSWVPTAVLQEYKPQLQVPSVEASPDMGIYLTELKTILAEYSTKLKEQTRIRQRCPSAVRERRQLLLDNPRLMSYQDKLLVFKKRLSQLVYMDSLVAVLLHKSFKGDSLLKRNELYQALLNKNWSKVKEIIPYFLGSNNESLALNAALEKALVSNAPILFIQYLLDQGAEFPETAIHLLTSSGNIALIRSLNGLGLNLHSVNPLGLNAVGHFVYRTEYAPMLNENKMLTFLLNNGIHLNSINGNLSPLDLALKNIKQAKPSLVYARTLIDYGATIELSNRQQMENLKASDLTTYQRVINLIPELDVMNWQ